MLLFHRDVLLMLVSLLLALIKNSEDKTVQFLIVFYPGQLSQLLLASDLHQRYMY